MLIRKCFLSFMLGAFVVIGLIGCGNGNSADQKSESENKGKAESIVEKSEVTKNDEENSELNDKTIGYTMEDFVNLFNENASKHGYEINIDEYDWESDTTVMSAGVELAEDIQLTGIKLADEEQLQGVLLEASGPESRQLVFDILETIIESSNPDFKKRDVKKVMKELGLSNPKKDGDDTESSTIHDGRKYLVDNGEGNWLEFIVINENDPEFAEY